MKISAAFRIASQTFFGHPGASLKFLTVEACMTLAAITPLLFLTSDSLKMLALLAAPFWVLLVFWARVNAAGAMREALGNGSLFGYVLADPGNYGKKLVYGLTRCLLLLCWAAPMIASVVIARLHMSGSLDGITVLRMIKSFGGGDLSTGLLYLILIFAATLILLAVGCAFHSGDRHAFVRNNPKLIRKHRGKIMLCWLCALVTLLPLIIALVILVIRYLPALRDLTAIVTKTKTLPSTRVTIMILAAGAVLTIPLLPLRSLITAAYVDGLEKE